MSTATAPTTTATISILPPLLSNIVYHQSDEGDDNSHPDNLFIEQIPQSPPPPPAPSLLLLLLSLSLSLSLSPL